MQYDGHVQVRCKVVSVLSISHSNTDYIFLISGLSESGTCRPYLDGRFRKTKMGPPLGGSTKLCSRIVLHGVKGETARNLNDIIGVRTIMTVSEIPHTPEERAKTACKGLASALDASCGGLRIGQRFDNIR